MSVGAGALERDLRLCVPVHSDVGVGWPHDRDFREAFDARMVQLADCLGEKRNSWPRLKLIYADIWVAHEAKMGPKDLSMRGPELYVRMSIDSDRLRGVPTAQRVNLVEIALLQGLLAAAARYDLHRELFSQLLTDRAREAGVNDPSSFGLPRPLSPEEVRLRSRPKPKAPPKLIRIKPDDHYAKYVGRNEHGEFFFLTRPFVPATGSAPGREFLALYRFSKSGALVAAEIDDLGMRANLDESRVAALVDERIAQMGRSKPVTIRVAPFTVSRFGETFGLVAQEPEFDGDDWSVTVEPGDYMAFYPPWDGEYDT